MGSLCLAKASTRTCHVALGVPVVRACCAPRQLIRKGSFLGGALQAHAAGSCKALIQGKRSVIFMVSFAKGALAQHSGNNGPALK